MNSLREYLISSGEKPIPSVNYLEGVVKDYPWFSMGHKLLARVSGRITPQVALMLYMHKSPAFFYKDYPRSEAVSCDVEEQGNIDTNALDVESCVVADATLVESREEVELTPVESIAPPLSTPLPPPLPPLPPPPPQMKPVLSETPPPMPKRVEEKVEIESIHVVEDRSKSEIIEKFLTGGDHKIVPKDNVPECIVDDAASVVSSGKTDYITPKLIKSQSRIEFTPEDDDEFLTEELAEIYKKQELYEQSMKIYTRLKLIYPEKSVYFADILSGLEKLVEKNN